jgi:hypothetical protein
MSARRDVRLEASCEGYVYRRVWPASATQPGRARRSPQDQHTCFCEHTDISAGAEQTAAWDERQERDALIARDRFRVDTSMSTKSIFASAADERRAISGG